MARTKRKKNQNQQQPPAQHAIVPSNQVATTNQNKQQPPAQPAIVPTKPGFTQMRRENRAIQLAVLEEQLRLDELVVKDLMSCRTSLAEEIETTRLKRQRLLERSVLLKERSLHLRAAKIKYGTLQKDLQESFAKSRERLARLSSLEELGHEDIMTSSEISALIEDVQSEQAEDYKAIESVNGSLDGNGQPEVTTGKQNHGSKETTTFFSASALRSASVDLYRDFWSRHRNRSSLMPFLPVVDPSLMSRILTISMKEAKALDVIHKIPSARRYLFRNTCLDFALMSITKIKTLDNDNSDAGKHAKALDPNVFLCPYELAGVCADDFCPYQHASKPTLPREQIPLPLLSVQPSQEKMATGSKPAGTSNRATRKRKKPSANASQDGAGNVTALQDFIALPKPDTDNDSDESVSDLDDDFDYKAICPLLAKPTNESSFTTSIENGGIIATGDSSVEQVFRNVNHETFSSIIDVIRLSLHSGRFDMAHSLIEQEIQPAWWKDLLQEVWYHCFQSPSKRISFIRTLFEDQATLLVLSICGDVSSRHSDMKSLLKDVLANMWMPDDIDSSTSMKFVMADFRNVLSGMQENCKSANQPLDSHFKFADLQKGILWGRKVFDKLSLKNVPLSRIDDRILRPCWLAMQRWVALLKPDEMIWAGIKGTIVMGLIILGCLESFASYIHDDQLSASIAASLISIEKTVSNILKGLSKLFSCVPMIDLLLSPLFAANVTTTTFVKRYSIAYHRLVRLLAIKARHHRRRPPRFMQFSELLWSQFLHLRMALPVALNSEPEDTKTTRSKRYPWELSAEVVNENQILLEKMEKRDLRLLHITLTGDSVFALALAHGLPIRIDKARGEQLRVGASKILQWVYGEVNQPDAASHSLELSDLPLHRGAPSSDWEIRSTISSLPLSLMLVGHSLQTLNLSNCRLSSLPATFGLYFPNLLVRHFLARIVPVVHLPLSHVLSFLSQSLDISRNLIQTLPSSFPSMLCLEWLSLAGNRLTVLSGEEFTASLKYLDLSNNFLKQFFDIAECLGRRSFQLEELNISCNEISNLNLLQEEVFPRWSLTMKSLHTVTCKPQLKAPFKESV